MAWNPQHKQQSRARILQAAAPLFARQGFDNTGIDQVMAAAGMTRGAFYSHFHSKSELYTEALMDAALQRLRPALQDPEDDTSPLDLQRLVQGYLHLDHVRGEAGGCPLAFLVSDIAQRDEAVRRTYTQLLLGLLGRIEAVSSAPRAQILQQMVLLIGGVAIARAVNEPQLQQELLAACGQGLHPQTLHQ